MRCFDNLSRALIRRFAGGVHRAGILFSILLVGVFTAGKINARLLEKSPEKFSSSGISSLP